MNNMSFTCSNPSCSSMQTVKFETLVPGKRHMQLHECTNCHRHIVMSCELIPRVQYTFLDTPDGWWDTRVEFAPMDPHISNEDFCYDNE